MFKNLFIRGARFLFHRQSSVLSAAVILMITYAGSMVLGILRERVLVAHFYSCCSSSLDAYIAAFRLPDMIFQLVVLGALSAAFIPVFSEQLVKDEKLAYRISSAVVTILVVFYLFLAGIIFIFTEKFSLLITGGFTREQIHLMSGLTRIMLFAQGFFLISDFLSAIIQSHRRFIIPAVAPLLYNLGIIAGVVFLAPIMGLWSAAVGVVIGAFLHLLVQVPLVFRLGFSYRFSLDYRLAGVKEIFRLMLPRSLGLAIYQVEATVAVFLATSLPAGSLTIFYLSQKLMDLPVRLFGTSIGQAALPLLSEQKAKTDETAFRETLISSLGEILYLALPATAAILILRIPLVRIAFGAKTFPWQATILTGRVVALISLAIFSQSMTQLLVRGFYARHNTKTPFFIALVSVTVNILMGTGFIFILSRGVTGLALATSVSSFIQASLLLIFLEKQIGGLLTKETIIDWLKMTLAAILAGVTFWATMKFLDLFILDTSKTFNLLFLTAVTTLSGLVVYFFTGRILKIKEGNRYLEVLSKIRKINRFFSPPPEIIGNGQNFAA